MLDVDSLTRFYGNVLAVSEVSFSIEGRQIVGLLGHNGAGKTTVMKMLSGYLEPSSGAITIGGRRLPEEARAIQQRLGYLPESLPVYPEMSVADYLDYAAQLKGLRGDNRQRAIRRSVEATDLGTRFLDPIGQLSRGFRQRVGVAQALLGDPELLILDEPGNGLDPEQNDHMRALIREISASATVILSTHVMQEVEALCDRVLVLADGGLALDDSLSALQESRHLLLKCSDDAVDLPALIQRLPQIEAVETLDDHPGCTSLRLSLFEGTALDTAAGNVSRVVVEVGARLFAIQPEKRDLEQVFRDAIRQREPHHDR